MTENLREYRQRSKKERASILFALSWDMGNYFLVCHVQHIPRYIGRSCLIGIREQRRNSTA